MKKMFYSEILNKYFEDEKECRREEIQYQLDKQEKKKEDAPTQVENGVNSQNKESTTALSKEKKALADAITDADNKLTNAQNDYQVARDKYRKRIEELKAEFVKATDAATTEILNPAAEAVKTAQQAKYKAIRDFNEKFGTYTVRYTGDKAFKEMQKTIEYMNNIFENFWF